VTVTRTLLHDAQVCLDGWFVNDFVRRSPGYHIVSPICRFGTMYQFPPAPIRRSNLNAHRASVLEGDQVTGAVWAHRSKDVIAALHKVNTYPHLIHCADAGFGEAVFGLSGLQPPALPHILYGTWARAISLPISICIEVLSTGGAAFRVFHKCVVDGFSHHVN